MRLYAAPDAVMCRSFPPTLRREARDWVATLSPRSIKSFDELSKSFVAYFLSNKKKRKTTIVLMQVVQDKDKSLQEYLARFSWATLGIRDLQMSAVVIALMNGTQNRAFKMSLSKNPPESMHDLLKKGDKYVDAEEAKKVTKNLRDGREREASKRKTYDKERHNDKNKWKNERTSKGYVQDRDHGHDTEECRQLKEEIERQLRQGLLAKYVKNDKGRQRAEGIPPPRAEVINMIIGGVASGGDSNSARKSYARSVGVCSIQKKARFNQSITFDEEDLIGVTHPHDDALVIVGDIADFDVKGVLVDGGSTTNVLTWDAFLGLKIPQEKLKVVTTPYKALEGQQ
ncbi:uncharacterized protein LOC111411120 [Olea europaea var. sylvestris]|uniref:uncharacterized protein LOC111411120 n=1 Tax=Olea europaea var. sylvestris TaxID=158386 RepID=UPI000C1D7905|nr:uncharacterized protein LOC111411120 [Olea europaea var. sylvestris]